MSNIECKTNFNTSNMAKKYHRTGLYDLKKRKQNYYQIRKFLDLYIQKV